MDNNLLSRQDEGQEVQLSNSMLPKEIETIEEMESFLYDLQREASGSLSAALNAQLQVIRYVSSPTLVDSSFDLLFKNIKDSVNLAVNEQEKNKILQQAHLMIHNYVFFLDARLEYAIQNNRKEGERLLELAAKELANTTAEFAIAYTTAGAGKGAQLARRSFNTRKIAYSIVQKGHNSGFFQKVIDWFLKSKKNKKEKQRFFSSLEKLFDKFERYQNLIGKSDLIGGLIERWSVEISENKHMILKKKIDKKTSAGWFAGLIFSLSLLFGIGMFSSIITILMDLIPYFENPFKSGSNTFSLWQHIKDYSLFIFIFFVCITLVDMCYTYVLKWIYEKRVSNDYLKYKSLADEFYE
ncbi:hypothetical protein [Riemerella anatipestifer]|uniref:hypothetical protein n=1 Tax=Riemerella anatipestifer TaxID=34085 RepID=UPI001BD97A2D|nr:hypothetical protein [Riemerella anatipestifer]MBT0552317.1 hypothetical protein [Riemerella anatipestifer]MBT0554551.1 hypothetical protein [Riemerella anatipestifer]MCE3025023.1 hypothetical protein [Riemerella anatipestifer]MCT6765703.1 hypothetical protein [Riemerella anatipestifer]MCT6769882.1 hypothetical protein [Riemerella anatipestifer]